jgi:hypothetical protein
MFATTRTGDGSATGWRGENGNQANRAEGQSVRCLLLSISRFAGVTGFAFGKTAARNTKMRAVCNLQIRTQSALLVFE